MIKFEPLLPTIVGFIFIEMTLIIEKTKLGGIHYTRETFIKPPWFDKKNHVGEGGV